MRVALVAVMVLVSACAGEVAVETTTSTVPVAEPTTITAPSTTTTTVAVEPVDTCPRGVVWEPGRTYSAACFFVPLSFGPVETGWQSLGGAENWLKVRWRDPDGEFRVRVGVIAYSPRNAPTEVLDQIAARELISEVSERMVVNVGGASGLMVDLEGDPTPGGETAEPGSGGCTGDDAVWLTGRFGYGLFEGAGFHLIGVGACDIARIWVLEVNEQTVTVIGGTADPDRHEEAVARIEKLLEGMTFEVAGS